VIRINLLPPSARRRRRRQPVREGVILGAMSLGWAVLISVGYLWIAATEAEVAERRTQVEALVAQTAAIETGESALARRQEQHRARQDALHRLQTARRSPTPLLFELAEAITGDPTASPFAEDLARPLVLTALQQDGGLWRVSGAARDHEALATLVRRLQVSRRVASVASAEYARAADGRLEFNLAVTVRE
jgi:Tfp pilus assembly protein PilN